MSSLSLICPSCLEFYQFHHLCFIYKGEVQGLWASGRRKWKLGERWCVQKALLALAHPRMSCHLEWGHCCALLCRAQCILHWGPSWFLHVPITIASLLSYLHTFLYAMLSKFQYSSYKIFMCLPWFSENVPWK